MDAPKNLGDQIREAIEDAINTQDFSVLKDTVSKTLSAASENISRSLNEASEAARRNQEKVNLETGRYKNTPQRPGPQSPYTPPTPVPAPQPKTLGADLFNSAKWQQSLAARQANQRLATRYTSTTGNNILGYSLAISGGVIGGGCLLAALITLAAAPITDGMSMVAARICAICSLPFVAMFGIGTNMVSQNKLFKRIKNILGPRQVCNINELAQRLRMKPQKLLKRIDKMLQKGWFREGHLDVKGDTLMVTDGAYNQYRHALALQAENQKQAALEAQQARQLQQKIQAADATGEIQKVLNQGNAYLAQIRACNAAIPGAEITNKIDQIDLVVQSIFARAEENPDVVSDLGRLMDYYLPTTVKLLEAYEDLDAQPIQTENILESKQQIEDTLDTLSVAFEKLLDSIFRDTAWDVSTDISVLHTVLAQEGLTDNPFEKKATETETNPFAQKAPKLTLTPFDQQSNS